MLSTLIPMLLDSNLDQLKVGLSDGLFPDGDGQHSHSIPEQDRGRQQKVGGDEKKFGQGGGYRKLS